MLSSLLAPSTSTSSVRTVFADALFCREPAPLENHALDPDLLQFRRAVDIGVAIQHGEVGFLAGGDTADHIIQADNLRRLDGDRAQRLVE